MPTKAHNRGHRIFTGTAGENYVAAELARRGAIATITSKTTPDFDVLASNGDATKTAIIQVKAGRTDTGGFIVGRDAMPHYPENAYHVFVLIKDDTAPEYWVIPSNEVSRIAEDDYQNWLLGRPESSSTAPRTLRWKHLRSEEFMKRYHGNWNQLGIFD